MDSTMEQPGPPWSSPHGFSWDKIFAVRRDNRAYASEDTIINTEGLTTTQVMHNFLTAKVNWAVHGPLEFSYASIREFIFRSEMPADLEELRNCAPSPGGRGKLALIDDRAEMPRQVTEKLLRRNWVVYGDGSPPSGNVVETLKLNEGELYKRLCLKPFGFAFEFHLPYYVLKREYAATPDSRGLRRSGPFIPTRGKNANEYIYEAQISFLMVGVDDWCWTVYCCVDVYFGSEESPDLYDEREQDAPLGGTKDRKWPVWNPRDYFLKVLSERVAQITREWSNVLCGLEERLRPHENTIFDEKLAASQLGTFVDDSNISQTKDYTWTLQVLRLLFNALTKTIEAWECFERDDTRYFNATEFNLQWASYFGDIRRNMKQLRDLRMSLQQKMESFENMRNNVVNVSVLAESRNSTEHARIATTQGENIGLLTMVTIVCHPNFLTH
ncbi:hypothetical protein FGG08_000016 [Glutinoglossum americanum]|uniref:Uncharacterized protein n=1 Tax=Glutinoglossum americanum TaxID=1670608 RepID=A0A9P8L680_9PEZI|nr:hypothetical protein FGG08_000016 [Glutinoglossum americanum]